MSIPLLELAAAALGDLTGEVVFTGGATVGLWITDPAAPEPRPTEDVDVIVEVTSRGAFADFEERLRQQQFHHDRLSDLGFANPWQGAAVPHAIDRRLPSGRSIAAVSPPYLMATKLEAFADRGHEDLIASRDFADIVTLLDGRAVGPGDRQRTRRPPRLRRRRADPASRPLALHGWRLRRPGSRRGQPSPRRADRHPAHRRDHRRRMRSVTSEAPLAARCRSLRRLTSAGRSSASPA